MGVGVSSWRLASAVAARGQLGVVSGTALDLVIARRLQDGDPDGSVRRALAAFPVPEVAQRVLTRYLRVGGRGGSPYRPVPRPSLRPSRAAQELTVVANFVEVWLAKQGHDGQVGVNYLEKVQMATPAAAYGAMLAGRRCRPDGRRHPASPSAPARRARRSTARCASRSTWQATPARDHAVELDPADLLGPGRDRAAAARTSSRSCPATCWSGTSTGTPRSAPTGS